MLADDDFRGLSVPAQHLYMILMIHPTLSYAGVADWRKGRIAAMSSGANSESVNAAAQELQSEHFIYVDEESEEVFVRSFVRHDGLLKQYRLPISMANDYAAISSPEIRTYFVHVMPKVMAKPMPRVMPTPFPNRRATLLDALLLQLHLLKKIKPSRRKSLKRFHDQTLNSFSISSKS